MYQVSRVAVCILKTLALFTTCKVLVKTRVMTEMLHFLALFTCFKALGRSKVKLRLDDVSCALRGQLVPCTYL